MNPDVVVDRPAGLRRVRRAGVLLALAGLLCAGAAQAAKPYVYAPLPMEEPEVVIRQVRPMLNFLEERTQRAIRIEYHQDYAEILDRFRAGQIDLAYLGPLPYVALREQYPQAEPVVHFLEKSGQPTYTCAIVTAGGKPPLASLKGKKIALTQPLSTCGYLSTDALLRPAGFGLDDTRFRYLDKHDEVALAVARGEFDAGGLKTGIAKKYAHLGLSIVAETKPLPAFALIANARTVSAADIRLMRALLTGGALAKTRQTWGDNLRNGAVAARDADYDTVRAHRLRKDIPHTGNF